MPIYISLLRGINVSGHKKVSMSQLSEMYEALGCARVITYIQSGNVVCDHAETNPVVLNQMIEQQIVVEFGFQVKVLTIEVAYLQSILEQNPFPAEDGTKLHVTFLAGTPSYFPTEQIDNAKAEGEDYRWIDTYVYIYCPNGYGKTKLTNDLFERQLRVGATTRNWNTVTKLVELATNF